jgi:hypothetical protein
LKKSFLSLEQKEKRLQDSISALDVSLNQRLASCKKSELVVKEERKEKVKEKQERVEYRSTVASEVGYLDSVGYNESNPYGNQRGKSEKKWANQLDRSHKHIDRSF